jgi:hypothetical protein
VTFGVEKQPIGRCEQATARLPDTIEGALLDRPSRGEEIWSEQVLNSKDLIDDRGYASRAMDANDYYVYTVARYNGEVVYVGKGRGSRASRDFTGPGQNQHLAVILERDRAAGHRETVAIVRAGLTESQAFAFEMELIGRIGRVCDGGMLVNQTNGGNGFDLAARQNGCRGFPSRTPSPRWAAASIRRAVCS